MEHFGRMFFDLTGRPWIVSTTPRGALRFKNRGEEVVLAKPPICWPRCSDDDLRAALTLAHIYDVIAAQHAVSAWEALPAGEAVPAAVSVAGNPS